MVTPREVAARAIYFIKLPSAIRAITAPSQPNGGEAEKEIHLFAHPRFLIFSYTGKPMVSPTPFQAGRLTP